VSLSELVALLERLGSVPSEGIDGFSELDHALQCAHELALDRPTDAGLHLAGLVHDVGHAFGPDERHDVLGAQAVRPLLGHRVGDLVGAHVVAKRYLATTEPSYRALLSIESTHTLAVQGGPLTPADVAAFERFAHFDDAIGLRRADDTAKVPGRVVPGLDHWVPMLRALSRAAT
jgi:predicted HD phosphohydrolase